MASSTAPTVAGCISDGVPPPRKILVTLRGPVRFRIVASSVAKAARKARLVDRLMADMAVEVAIGAFGRAEWPMDVDAEAGLALSASHAEPSLARANFWKARARCDSASACPGFQPCFSSAVISPKVLS